MISADAHRYQFMFCRAENSACGYDYILVYFEVTDGNTTKDGIVVPSMYSAGKALTPPIIPQAAKGEGE